MSELKDSRNNPKCHAPSDCKWCECCDMCCECFEKFALLAKLKERNDYLEKRLTREIEKRLVCESKYHNLLTGE